MKRAGMLTVLMAGMMGTIAAAPAAPAAPAPAAPAATAPTVYRSLAALLAKCPKSAMPERGKQWEHAHIDLINRWLKREVKGAKFEGALIFLYAEGGDDRSSAACSGDDFRFADIRVRGPETDCVFSAADLVKLAKLHRGDHFRVAGTIESCVAGGPYTADDGTVSIGLEIHLIDCRLIGR